MKKISVFDLIAPIYGLFYERQIRQFQKVIDRLSAEIDISVGKTAVDVGCGTGALCSVLSDRGLTVSGADPSNVMLKVAERKKGSRSIAFTRANALERMPFEDISFDLTFTSYVLHGLKEADRKTMYAELGRITKGYIIIHDYNEKRALHTTLIEWLEGGDYFGFIKHAPEEIGRAFSEVRTVMVGPRAVCYICKPHDTLQSE
ncbi:MAG: class I SAM-dependent methyltransferase [Anaerofustis sp.]